jgi:hypothetical protein
VDRLHGRPEAPEFRRMIEDRCLSWTNNDKLPGFAGSRMLLFRPFVLGDILTKLARMCSIERFRKTDLKPIIRRVFDDHPHPGRRLQDRPMAAKQLANRCEAKGLADTVLHGQALIAGLEGLKQRNPQIAKGKRKHCKRNRRCVGK